MSPVLFPPHDGTDAERVAASSRDPLVMYLVAPRRFEGLTGELLVDAALATLRCSDAFAAELEWAENFRAWQEFSFRKVCLRARPVEMERAAALPHASAGSVLCFPPRLRSLAEPELAKLQAHIGPALSAGDERVGELPPQTMLLLICQDLEMTAGKACAQVGHAVLLGELLLPASAISAWREAGCPLAAGLVDGETFERVKSELTVAGVRDAGLTQVRAGAETVLAVEPCAALPEWLGEAVRVVA